MKLARTRRAIDVARLYANENFPAAVVEGLRALGHDVPESDVERRLGTHQHLERQILQAVPDRLPLQRIGAENARRKVPQGLEDRQVEPSGGVRRRCADPHLTAVVEHPHDGQRAVLLIEVGGPAVPIDIRP